MTGAAIGISITLKGSLARHGPSDQGGRVDISLPDGATVADAIAVLALPEGSVAFAALNGRRAAGMDRLKAGDELTLFSRLGGG
jgi:sulfur carrier protein ThiS